jgi:hypothetical protein
MPIINAVEGGGPAWPRHHPATRHGSSWMMRFVTFNGGRAPTDAQAELNVLVRSAAAAMNTRRVDGRVCPSGAPIHASWKPVVEQLAELQIAEHGVGSRASSETGRG